MNVIVREYFARVLSLRVVLTWFISSVAATLAGPFGTYDGFSLGERAVYWPGIIALALAIAIFVRLVVQSLLPSAGSWTEDGVVALLFTLAFAPLLIFITYWMTDVPREEIMAPPLMVLAVFSVPLAASAVRNIVLGQEPDEMEPSGPEKPRLLKRLDTAASTIHRLHVRDHYVDVFTDTGQASLLMRFSDALAEVEGVPGLRVHRSHWVSLEAVARIEREKGRMFIYLNDGERVPVSRNYRDIVEQMALPANG